MNSLQKRKCRLRSKIRRDRELGNHKPKVNVFRSNRYFYAQIVNIAGQVVLSVSSREDFITAKCKKTSNVEAARLTGELLSKKIADYAGPDDLSKLIFDRSGYKYEGKIAAFADGLRLNNEIEV